MTTAYDWCQHEATFSPTPHGHGLSTYRRTLLHSPSSERLARPLVRQPVGRSQKGIRRLPNAGSGQPGSIATVIYRISLCTDHLACRVTAEDGLEMSWFPGPSWQHGKICFPKPYNTEYFKTLNPLYEVASGFAKKPVYSAHKVKWRNY